VSSVAPYHMDEDYGLGAYSRLKGAQLYVAAQPGLTSEWLTLTVQRELATDGQPNDTACRPNVQGVSVSVVPAGGGYWVVHSAPDERSAESVLSWARSRVSGARKGA